MASERMEWIEIIEPRTKEHMYANLTTGECVWDPPLGVPVKKTDNNQWWELFDQNTSRFYYYNATSQKTVWHRPQNCDIIPLAKLQTLKQNTEPACVEEHSSTESSTASRKTKESVGTQTPGRSAPRTTHSSHTPHNKEVNDVAAAIKVKNAGVQRLGGSAAITTETQTSPLSSPRPARRTHHHHHHHHHRHQQQLQQTPQQQLPPAVQAQSQQQAQQQQQQAQQVQSQTQAQQHSTPGRGVSNDGSGRPRRGSQGSWYSRTARTQDTSDSSCVSLSRNSLESPNHQTVSGLTLSTSTPQLKKKPLSDSSNHQQPPAVLQMNTAGNKLQAPSGVSVHRSASNASTHHLPAKQKSFDVDISVGGGYSLGHENRSSGGSGTTGRSPRSLMPSSLSNNQLSLSRSQSFAQRQPPTSSTIEQQTPTMPLTSTLSLDQEEEDSMHEKYFVPGAHLTPGRRSIESTPQARRKHHHHHHRCPKLSPDYANLASSVPPPPRHSRSSSSNSSTLAQPTNRRDRRDREQAPPATNNREAGLSSSENEGQVDDDVSSSLSSSPPVPNPSPALLDNSGSTDSGVLLKRLPNHQQAQPPQLSLPYNHHQQQQDDSRQQQLPPPQQQQLRNKPTAASSPIYSNQPPAIPLPPAFLHDAEMHSHLLPLQQYILEQAKLSGCYRFGDSLAEEADSLHSEEDDGPVIRGGVEYDSDEFADDEAMSNQDDSSSQEYLHDEPSYLDTVEQYRYVNTDSARLNYTPDGRVSDYVVDSLESRMAASSGYNSNLTSLSTSHQHSVTRPNNHLTSTGPLGHSPTLPLETQHASLKRKKDPPVIAPVLYSPIMERAERLNLSRRATPSPPLIFSHNRPPQSNPHSLPSSLPSSPLSATMQLDQLSRVVLNRDKKLPSESDIEKYAQDNLNIHKKGIFRKKFSVRDMLSWSKDPIRKPMLVHSDKALKKDATELFKLVQTYMSDRKAKVGMTLNSVALEICTYGYAKPALRDEIYIQICRQTTENPRRESLRRGWELLAICLSFFPPSSKFQAYLDGYMNRHRDPSFDFPEVGKWPIHVQVSHYASVACKRLERGGVCGKRPPRKPTLEEIDQARLQIFRPSMFGSTLQEVMAMQRDRFPHCKLPWIQTTLSEEVLRLQGAQTEGIFRVSADVDEVTCLKMQLDRWERPSECTDAHTPASLLKLWYRELYEPLIPDSMYGECIVHHDNPERVLQIVDNLPEINRLVLSYLVRFLQIFARPEVVQQTKMDASNLAMVMAPNCLRCTSSDPRVIFDNARKEMAFMRTLIQCLDTTFMDNIKRTHDRD